MLGFKYVFATFIITFGSSFQFGFQTGVINAPLKIIEKFIVEVTTNRTGPPTKEFVSTMSSLVVAAFPVGGIIGAVIGGTMSNRMGRKLSLFIFNIPMIIGSCLMMASKAAFTFEMLILGRAFVGLACGAYTGIAPVYLSEIATIDKRGASGITNQLAVVSAIFISQILGLTEVMGTDTLWPYLVGFSVGPGIVLLLFLWICPDSPRYMLLTASDEPGARAALKWYRNSTANVDMEIEEMLKEQHLNENESFRIHDLFRTKALRLAIGISIVAHLAQQFSGINAALFYSTSLFTSIGFSETIAAYATLGVGGMMILVTIISIFLIERVGRRVLLISGLLVMLGSAIFITIGLATRQYHANMVYMGIVYVYIFVGGFAIGPGSIPWFIVAELFVQETRDSAVMVTVVVNWISQIIISMGYPQLLVYLKDYSFVPFIVLLIIFVSLLYVYLPETRGKSSIEVQEEFMKMSGDASHIAFHQETNKPFRSSVRSPNVLHHDVF